MRLEVFFSFAAIAAWLLLAWYTLRRPTARRSGTGTGAAANAAAPGSAGTAVVYASQTGTALDIARRTAQAFGKRADLLPMDAITPEQLSAYQQALFIVSTYGEGDPPDMAQAFHQRMPALSSESGALQGLEVGVLALGDSSYDRFCGFGMALDTWLQEHGATMGFDTIKADRADPGALSAWADALSRRFQVSFDADLPFDTWTLTQRTVSNPNGQGRPCHELQFQPKSHAAPEWKAGDIAIIRIDGRAEHREYSIASIPSEGVLRLLVREHQKPDGSPGLGSGWLSAGLAIGGPADLHIRSNPLFHAPEDDRPAVFIGNGTGIAGLRSLLEERIAQGRHDNWLVFGERSRATDFHWGAHLENGLAQGRLSRLDVAFSRDQAEKRYVHHLLRESAAEVRAWAGRGAVFYVCGSKEGMAQDVDRALRDVLGPHGYQALLQRQGYRRDVY